MVNGGLNTCFKSGAIMAKIEKTDAEWSKELSPESFQVTRKHGTERAFTSPLNDEKAQRHVRLHLLRQASVSIRYQV